MQVRCMSVAWLWFQERDDVSAKVHDFQVWSRYMYSQRFCLFHCRNLKILKLIDIPKLHRDLQHDVVIRNSFPAHCDIHVEFSDAHDGVD